MHRYRKFGVTVGVGLVVIAAPLGGTLRASAVPSHVTFWNTLDSADAVQHSQVGPNLTTSAATDFGTVGGATGLTVQGHYTPGARIVNTTLSDAPSVINPDHGALSVWYYQVAATIPYDYGIYRIFGGPFSPYGELLYLYAYDSPSRIHASLGAIDVTSRVDHAPGVAADSLTGRWTHITVVWDRNGINGSTAGIRLYFDDVLVASARKKNWPATMGPNADIGGGNDTDLAQKFYLHDMYAWDSAAVDPPTTAPTDASASLTGRTALVSFTAPATDTATPLFHYVTMCSSADGGATRTGASTGSPASVHALTPGATYTCSVRATNLGGGGPESASSNPVTVLDRPAAPANAVATLTGDSASVSFDPPNDGGNPIIGYRATCSSGTGGSTAHGTASASPVIVPRLSGSSTYSCVVNAVNSVGGGPTSGPSPEISTPVGLPGAPSNLTATVSGHSVDFAFAAAFDGGSAISTYRVECTRTFDGLHRRGAAAAAPVTLPHLPTGAFVCSVAARNGFGRGRAADAIPVTVV